MPNVRADIAMSDSEVVEFLRSGHTLILVTIGPDGVPDPVPMWYLVDDAGQVWMRTYARSQKVLNLRRDPRVSAIVEEGRRYADLRAVQVTGMVELVEDPDRICDVFAGLMVKYEGMDPAHVPAAREGYRAKAAKQVAMRIVPERVVSWDHRKMAGSPSGSA